MRAVVAQLDEAGWTVGNVDITVIAQTPRLSEHVAEMREHIAADLGVTVGSVNVKATTTEKLGFVGREEGIACHAVALLTNESASA